MMRYQFQPVLQGFVWGLSASLLLVIVASVSCREAGSDTLPMTRAPTGHQSISPPHRSKHSLVRQPSRPTTLPYSHSMVA